jgi:hypothetical protein
MPRAMQLVRDVTCRVSIGVDDSDHRVLVQQLKGRDMKISHHPARPHQQQRFAGRADRRPGSTGERHQGPSLCNGELALVDCRCVVRGEPWDGQPDL